LVQTDEAHSSQWSVYIDEIFGIEEPEPHKTFADRVARANHFIEKYNPPYPVYIDGWNNEFSNLFRAWPDKYHAIDSGFKVIAKAEYHTDKMNEAKVVEDYVDLLKKWFNE
jgi:hypothetical protein